MQKKKHQDTNLTTITKINQKWIRDINVYEIIKLEDINNKRENLDDFGYDDAFLDTMLKLWSMKEIIHKLDFIKMKNMSAKDNV